MSKTTISSDRFLFIAATNYHIIVAGLLRGSLPENAHCTLVIKSSLKNSTKLVSRLHEHEFWDKVTLFDSSMEVGYALKSPVEKAFALAILRKRVRVFLKGNFAEALFVFTVGDLVSNFFSAEARSRTVHLAEDGTFPYYGGAQMYDDGTELHRLMTTPDQPKLEFLSRILKKLAWLTRLVFPAAQIDAKTWFNDVVLLAPELYDRSNDSTYLPTRPVKLSDDYLKQQFIRYTKIFGYKQSKIYREVDVVFIDSGMGSVFVDSGRVGEEKALMEEQILITREHLERFENKKILIKVSPYSSDERLRFLEQAFVGLENVYFDYQNIHVPWEVIFANNREKFEDATIATYRSTAAISPFIIFGAKPKIHILCNLIPRKFSSRNTDRVLNKQFLELISCLEKIYPAERILVPNE